MNATAQIMLELRKNVSPEFFDRRRKYATKPLELEKPLWKGPDGEMTTTVQNNTNADHSIAMIDILLYGADEATQGRITSQLVYFPTRVKEKFQSIFENADFVSLRQRVISENLSDDNPLLPPLSELFKGMWRWRTMHNSAVSTHLRQLGKGRSATGAGYEYDEFLTDLIRRSEQAYKAVKK